MWGYFSKEVDLKNNDIIFSVDADEIVYEHFYQPIIRKINFFCPRILLNFYTFFYRINYLWVSEDCKAPIACKAGFYKNEYPASWRYEGKLFSHRPGCHFSWCLTIDEMIHKLKVYGHADIYGHFAKREILEDAVENKKYPFEPDKLFDIRVLDLDRDRDYYPKSIYSMLDEFNYLIGK
jgi:Glycosyltransferase family 17